jgi:hypothetical protein
MAHQQIAHKDRSASEKLSRDLADAINKGSQPNSASVDKLAEFTVAQAQRSEALTSDMAELRLMMAQTMQANQLLLARLLGSEQPSGAMPPPSPVSTGETPTLPSQRPAQRRPPQRRQKPKGKARAVHLAEDVAAAADMAAAAASE